MNEKVQKFIALVSSKLGCGYVWGSQGEILTSAELQRLINWFGREHYFLSDGTRADKWIGKQVFDCSGLIVWALRELGLIGKTADYNTDGLFGMCTNLYSRDELQTGDLVFGGNGSSTWHVGIYVGNGYTVHAMSTAAGVVKTSWAEFNSWNMYGRLKCLNGGNGVLKKGSIGSEVKGLQEKLNKLGYGLAVDGDFGPATEAAVRSFQSGNGLVVDGIVGPTTLAKLDEVLNRMNPQPVIDWEKKYSDLATKIKALAAEL